MIVSYGGHGGDKCAAQLGQVCEGLHMALIPTAVGLTLPREMIEANARRYRPGDPVRHPPAPTCADAFAEFAAARQPTT